MKKQKTKKKTVAKRYVAHAKPVAKSVGKPKAKPVAKSVGKPKAKPVAKSVGKPKKSKPVVAAPPIPVVESVVVTRPPALPSPVVKPNVPSDSDRLREIELALEEAERSVTGVAIVRTALQSASPVSTRLTAEVTDLLEELIDTASPKLASTVSRLAYVLCDVMPGLQPVSERADMVLCRKLGVTFGWDRRAEAERAVHSGKRQKTISVS
jgi:hypothetical protein